MQERNLSGWNAISERVVSVCRAYFVHCQAIRPLMDFQCALYGQSAPGGHAPPESLAALVGRWTITGDDNGIRVKKTMKLLDSLS
jgi:hypothetical protein